MTVWVVIWTEAFKVEVLGTFKKLSEARICLETRMKQTKERWVHDGRETWYNEDCTIVLRIQPLEVKEEKNEEATSNPMVSLQRRS